MRFSTRHGEPWRVEIFDVQGRRVTPLARGVGTGGTEALRWSATFERGVAVARGVYWVRLTRGADRSVQRVAILGER